MLVKSYLSDTMTANVPKMKFVFKSMYVYGFNMGDDVSVIDIQYLSDYYPKIKEYGIAVYDNYVGEIVYGTPVGIDESRYSDDEYADDAGGVFDQLSDLYDEYVGYLRKYNPKQAENCELRHHAVIMGNFIYDENRQYILPKNLKNDDSDEEIIACPDDYEHRMFNPENTMMGVEMFKQMFEKTVKANKTMRYGDVIGCKDKFSLSMENSAHNETANYHGPSIEELEYIKEQIQNCKHYRTIEQRHKYFTPEQAKTFVSDPDIGEEEYD